MNKIEEKVKSIAVCILKDNLLEKVKIDFDNDSFNSAIENAFDEISDQVIRDIIETRFDISYSEVNNIIPNLIPEYCNSFIDLFKNDDVEYYNGIVEVAQQARTILEEDLADAIYNDYRDEFFQMIFEDFYTDIKGIHTKEFVEFIKVSCERNHDNDGLLIAETKSYVEKLIDSI